MKTWLSILLCCAISPAFACVVAPACDTLFTKDGKVYSINYFGTENNKIEYALCDDSTGRHYKIAKSRVERVGVSKSEKKNVGKPRPDRIEKLARSAYINTLIGIIGIFVISFLAIPFMLIGIIKGEKALRLLKKAKGHPNEVKIKRQARTAILVPVISLVCIISLYVLILFLV